MLGQYLITSREVLEAALIISIVLAYLARTGRNPLSCYVRYGVFSATATSLVLGATIWLAFGSLPKSAKVLFEGSATLIVVVVLSSMIYWMATKGKRLRKEDGTSGGRNRHSWCDSRVDFILIHRGFSRGP